MDLWVLALGVSALVALIPLWDWWTRTGSAAVASADELERVLKESRLALLGVGLFSGVINILMLTGSFFMLEVYDRVLPSRSLPTLVALSLLVAMLLVAQGGLELIRSRILTRIGATLDESLSARVFETCVRLPLRTVDRGNGLQTARDLDTVRLFLSGLGPTALFDLPWMPLYIALIYAFHPILGHAVLAGAVLLVALTLLTEALTKAPASDASVRSATRMRLGEACVRNAEVLTAMGVVGRMGERWRGVGRTLIAAQQRIADVSSGLGALTKMLRMALQSGVLALGAYLVIRGEATAGIIIAAAILTSRALAPVELAIAHWKSFVAARRSWARLRQVFELVPPAAEPLALPAPSQRLSVEGVSIAAPGEPRLIVQEAHFMLAAGQGLGIVGPSASGKSTLVRTIVGVWPAARGKVRLDGAALDQWSNEALGRHIGYLPQDVELFSGTVAANIARFDPAATPEAVIAAARAAGVHDLIVALKQGYETEIGEHGSMLSAGQRQRIALARALYGDPFLVVLDEPNSNLDAEGEVALTRAIIGVRQRGGIAIVVAHRPSALAALDMVLAMASGRQLAFKPKEEVLGKVPASGAAALVPLKVVPDAGRSA